MEALTKATKPSRASCPACRCHRGPCLTCSLALAEHLKAECGLLANAHGLRIFLAMMSPANAPQITLATSPEMWAIAKQTGFESHYPTAGDCTANQQRLTRVNILRTMGKNRLHMVRPHTHSKVGLRGTLRVGELNPDNQEQSH